MNELAKAQSTTSCHLNFNQELEDHTKMSGHHFTFPPPPPAPPKASQSYPGLSQPFADPNGYRGRGIRGDHGIRGHGRDYNRGGRRGGSYGSSQSTPSYGNSFLGAEIRHTSPPDTGYSVQTNGHRRSGYPLPSYPPVQLPHYPTSLHQGYRQQTPAFQADVQAPQAVYPANRNDSPLNHNAQQRSSSHGYGPSFATVQASLPAAQKNSSFQTNAHAGQAVLMGPPIRMGFDPPQNGHQPQQHAQPMANGANAYQHGLSNGSDSPYQHSSPMGFPSSRHESPNSFPGHHGRVQKSGHGEAFNRPRNQKHRIQVAPLLPSFGSPLPLPIKPPALHESTRKPRKKKRRHNQLGLTPKAEKHESSEEEEDDADEEARLAGVAASAGQGRQL